MLIQGAFTSTASQPAPLRELTLWAHVVNSVSTGTACPNGSKWAGEEGPALLPWGRLWWASLSGERGPCWGWSHVRRV